jgi:hypothetical protein
VGSGRPSASRRLSRRAPRVTLLPLLLGAAVRLAFGHMAIPVIVTGSLLASHPARPHCDRDSHCTVSCFDYLSLRRG